MADSRSLKSPKFAVRITEALIETSEKRSSGHCMIADGVSLARGAASRVAVDIQTIRFTEAGRRYTYLTPRRCQIALIKFDQGIHCEPFEFQLRNGQSTPAGTAPAKERAKLVRSKGGNRRTVPERQGGRTPPRLPNQRRAFGLRGLEL